QAPVSLRDLPSTIADMLGFERDAPFPGSSLARYWKTPLTTASVHEDPLLAELNHVSGQPDWFPVSKGNMKSIVFRGMRYIKNGDGTEELYDYDQDPWELHNLALSADHRDTLEQLRASLNQTIDQQIP